ncbi:apolipoprotein N-acyltransferase, partial [Pseudoalteromonas agarivorans]
EFVPFQDILRPIAPLIDLPMSSFTRGDKIQNNLLANGFNLLPAISYEIVFADLVRGNYKSDSDVLFTVSID